MASWSSRIDPTPSTINEYGLIFTQSAAGRGDDRYLDKAVRLLS
jgi:hypothetical protein